MESKWWLLKEADECMPEPKSGPDEFILGPLGGLPSKFFYIGREAEFEGDIYASKELLTIGDIVEFTTQQDLGKAEVLFKADGTYEEIEPIPNGYNWCWKAGDSELSGDTLQEIADIIKEDPQQISGESEKIQISFFKNNEVPVIYRLKSADNNQGAHFKQVTAYVMADGTTEALGSDE